MDPDPTYGGGRPSRIRGGRSGERGGRPITTSRCREKLVSSWQASARRSTVSKQPSDSRSTASGRNPRTLRRDGDLALLPRIRAGASARPLAALMGRIGEPEAYFTTISNRPRYRTQQSNRAAPELQNVAHNRHLRQRLRISDRWSIAPNYKECLQPDMAFFH